MKSWAKSLKTSKVLHLEHFVKICYSATFYPTALKGCRGTVFTPGVRMGGRREIDGPGCISETIRCRKFILGTDIGWGCRCATSWSDLDL